LEACQRTEFEKLCTELLELNGFENLQWYGSGGGDKGRDIVATKIESPISGVRRQRNWVVQCKRYIRTTVKKQEISEFLTAAREHEPDAVLIIVTRTLTANTRDWLEAVRKEYRFEICTWEERDLEREIGRFRTQLSKLPPIVPDPKRVTTFSAIGESGVTYFPDIASQFEEVGIHLMNSYGAERDRQILEEFIEFIRHNEVRFDLGSEDEEA
jgi:predicted helicase